jgi:nitroimidazol reductase NimA-like FMN-containing flavoprotein (pyridoxamine 5'-phosphate oxidase superfamily)
MTESERERFLADLHVGIFSVADGERGPLSCPVWYAYEPGGAIVFVTARDSRKAKALASATRASFVVQSEELPYKYVSVEGPVSMEEASLEKHVRPITYRYLGEKAGDEYLASPESEAETEILVRIQPERWLTTDYAKEAADG